MNFLQKSVAAPVCLGVSLCLSGCGKAVQVVVPSNFHGSVVVHCTSTGMNENPLRADDNGVADGVCPSFETGVLVYRDGRQASVRRSPGWTRTADGLPTSIHIAVD